LVVTWDDSAAESRSSAELLTAFETMSAAPGKTARAEGSIEDGLKAAAKTAELVYRFPYLPHAPLEPNDCVIRRTADGGAELIFGSQLQTIDQGAAAAVLGLKPEQVQIKTLLAGGSFGRRATPVGDMAVEAANVLKAAKHTGPIKVMWSREDDIKGGRYRPIMLHRLKGGIDAAGEIVVWDNTIVGQSFIFGGPFEGLLVKDGVDGTMVEGSANIPYAIPNLRVSAHVVDVGVSTLWWRSVGSTHTAFAVETFLDHLAEMAGQDPVSVRRKLLAKHPRHLGVLELVVEKSGWDTPLPAGRARGIAVHESFNSFVAQVVEVSAGEDGLPKVERVVCAVDCGIAVNPDIIRAQMEGGIGYGLSAALYGAVDLEAGAIKQGNFDDYRVLRINEMPAVEVHIVPSDAKPTGVGEPGVPPIAPAVANAWAKLTGKRITDLPMSRSISGA
jgi:isoquinoline 1-oxidoreductase beta subunit